MRTVVLGSKWLRRAIWAWPIVAAIALGVIGLFLRSAVERRLTEETASQLQTFLSAEVTAVRLWMQSQQKTVLSAAVDTKVVAAVQKLAELAKTPDITQLNLLESLDLQYLRDQLTPFFEAGGYNGWVIVTPDQRILGAEQNELIGIENPRSDQPYAEKAFHGVQTVSPPPKESCSAP